MSTPPKGPLCDAINILGLVNGLAPVGVRLVLALLQRLQGLTDEEILKGADDTWDSVISTAKTELGQK